MIRPVTFLFMLFSIVIVLFYITRDTTPELKTSQVVMQQITRDYPKSHTHSQKSFCYWISRQWCLVELQYSRVGSARPTQSMDV